MNWLSRLSGSVGDHRSSPPADVPRRDRYTTLYATVPAECSGALRGDLVRLCGDSMEMLRFAPIAGTRQVRLALRLPRTGVPAATEILMKYGPLVEFMDVPETPSSSWLDGLLARPIPPTLPANPLAEILQPQDIVLDLVVANKRELFLHIGEWVCRRHGLPAPLVSDKLAAREQGGVTAVGLGLAIPHARLKDLRQAVALYARLNTPLPFDATDQQPVTDVLTLLVPERASHRHLDLLATAAQLFCDTDFREKLRACRSPAEAQSLFAVTRTKPI